jgi:hypothetical protein
MNINTENISLLLCKLVITGTLKPYHKLLVFFEGRNLTRDHALTIKM